MHAVSTAKAEKDCEAWLDRQFVGGTQKTKPALRVEAQGIYPNLSKRGFDRVWGTVAPRFERDRPGAKKKSTQ